MPDAVTDNPLDHSAVHEQRIRVRAYHLWQQDGCLDGHAAEYWERAEELDAMATYEPTPLPSATDAAPLVEQAVLEENLGEFPTSFADKGDRMSTPESREIAREFRDGER